MGNLSFALAIAVTLTVVRFSGGQTHDFVSDVYTTPGGFRTAIVSWNVQTSGGSWIEAHLRARVHGRWTSWFDMGHWSHDLSLGHRHSVKGGADPDGRVDTDTLILNKPADAWQTQLVMHSGTNANSPLVSLVAVTTDAPTLQAAASQQAWGVDIDVPERTQRIEESPDALAGGGDAWCSPTSVSMIMAYWSARIGHPEWDVGVAESARGTYDPVYDGCGNWPFNVAFASEHELGGWVEQLAGMPAMERYIAAGVPLVASIRVKPGELDGSPYPKTEGHLLVVRGFTTSGDVITNDPYGLPGHIRIVYKRLQFEHCWLSGSGGVVYVIAPPAQLRVLQP